MSEKNKAILAIRVVIFIIGAGILAWFGYMYVRAITLYGPGINFWYFTSSSTTNFGYTLLVHFALLVLVGMALYPGKKPLSSVLILIGTSSLAVGRALTINISFWFYYAVNPPLGMVLMVVGVIALILAARIDQVISLPGTQPETGPAVIE